VFTKIKKGGRMQSLALLWFQLQMTQQYLHEKTLRPAQSPANSANLNTPIAISTLASVKRTRTKLLLRAAASIVLAAFVQQAGPTEPKNFSPNAPVPPQAPVHVHPEKAGAWQIVAEEAVSVIRPQKSDAATLQLPGQLSAYIDRLNALEAFKLLPAPFDGIVTARDVDVGAYVANGSGHELFRVARTSPLRIYVNIPRHDAQLIKIGMGGDLALPQFPNR
jgi:hypothetical protein